jgi:hypothetical protein
MAVARMDEKRAGKGCCDKNTRDLYMFFACLNPIRGVSLLDISPASIPASKPYHAVE